MTNALRPLLLPTLLAALLLNPAAAQHPPASDDSPVRRRAMMNQEFLADREAAEKRKAEPPQAEPEKPPAPKDRPGTPPAPNRASDKTRPPARERKTPAAERPAFLGLTLWTLVSSEQPSPDSAPGQRGLVHVKTPQGSTSYAARRRSLRDPIRPGERVRLTVESTREGYLYMLNEDIATGPDNREQATGLDLIFPSSRLLAGANRVNAGAPLEVPRPADDPSYFTLEATQPGQTAVEVTFIVSPTPLRELALVNGQLSLTGSQFRSLVARWGSVTEYLDDPATIGAWYTKEEERAGNALARLGATSPLPQALFTWKPTQGRPMVVTTRLRVANQ